MEDYRRKTRPHPLLGLGGEIPRPLLLPLLGGEAGNSRCTWLGGKNIPRDIIKVRKVCHLYLTYLKKKVVTNDIDEKGKMSNDISTV